MEKEMITLS